MWPNQGPPPLPMCQQNPAFPPGHCAPYVTTPGPGIYPHAPHPAYPGYPAGQYPAGPYPAGPYPAGQYPAGHYSTPMNPAMIPHGPTGVMPHGALGPHPYPMHPAGHPFHPRDVHLGPILHSSKGFGHGPYKGYHHHHHDGFNPAAGILAGGMAVGMGFLGHKANKKMRKKMKKAHKYHMHGYYKHGKVRLS
ncbi:hypothetical protein GOODEAATRI_024275 [Goodea atripinnis]|uniref:Proline-rich protein 13 n=1 Tax=Goodea atripinnis TaxID=208336 RepID=A0ABV0P7E2_9TELE